MSTTIREAALTAGNRTSVFSVASTLFAMLFALFWNGRMRAWLWTGGLAAFALYGVLRVFEGL